MVGAKWSEVQIKCLGGLDIDSGELNSKTEHMLLGLQPGSH